MVTETINIRRGPVRRATGTEVAVAMFLSVSCTRPKCAKALRRTARAVTLRNASSHMAVSSSGSQDVTRSTSLVGVAILRCMGPVTMGPVVCSSTKWDHPVQQVSVLDLDRCNHRLAHSNSPINLSSSSRLRLSPVLSATSNSPTKRHHVDLPVSLACRFP